jgi:hypothetical protein
MNNLISITGLKRSGKDTIAEYIINNYGYVRYSFADPIKRGLIEMFGFSHEQMWGDEKDKETIDPRWNVSPRKMLQIIGTELFQYDIHKYMNEDEFNVGRNIWVLKFKYWYLKERETNPNLKIIIPDLRFIHEEKILKELNATIVKVIRTNTNNSDAHASEVEQDSIKPDIIINNDSSLDDLYKKIENEIVK